MLHQTFNFAAANYLTLAPSSYQGPCISLQIGERIRRYPPARLRHLPALCISLYSQRISVTVVVEMVILPFRNATVSFVRCWYGTRGFTAQGRQERTPAHFALAKGITAGTPAPDIAVGTHPAACAGTADAVPSLLPRTAVPTLDGKKNVLREYWAKDDPILAFCIHSSVRRFCQEVINLLHT